VTDGVNDALDEGFLKQRNPELMRLAAVTSKDQMIHSALVLHCRQPVVHRYSSPLPKVPESKPKLTCNKT